MSVRLLSDHFDISAFPTISRRQNGTTNPLCLSYKVDHERVVGLLTQSGRHTKKKGCDPADAREMENSATRIDIGENGFPSHVDWKCVEDPNQQGGKPMQYGTWMVKVLASVGIAKEVEDVVRQKNGGLPGTGTCAAGDEVPAASDDSRSDAAVGRKFAGSHA